MTDREKLIELIREVEHTCRQAECWDCKIYVLEGGNCQAEPIANHLISNGVTISARCGEADDFADKLYPLTIVKDRYRGVYSGGKYTAWLLDAEEVPKEIFGEDIEARGYWYDHDPLCGKGDTVSSAIMDLAGKAER